MSHNSELILEGSYLYFQKDVNYSQENFKLIYFNDSQTYQVYSEILSRIETGEFLKILVRYQMNQHFTPVMCRIEKSIGKRYAQEVYTIDTVTQELNYVFQNSETSQEFKRTINTKHYITSPAVCTAAMFTLTRKFDATGRTSINLISSDNDWTFNGPPTEKLIFGEFKTRDSDFKLNGNSLSASHLCLYESDTSQAHIETPVDLYLSKHYAVPYELIQGDLRIVIKNLKNHQMG